MQIELKGVTSLTNEWKPDNNIYFTREIIKGIIKDEHLDQDMLCIQDVSFDSSKQTFNNVILDCTDYKGQKIFLVKTDVIETELDTFFCYVVKRDFNTANYVTLSLKIDTITTNYDNFYSEKFAGECYIERTNNYIPKINDIHSDSCASIISDQKNFSPTKTPINNEIDVFIQDNIYNYNKVLDVENRGTMILYLNNKGSLFYSSKNKGSFLGYQSISNKNDKSFLVKENIPPNIATAIAKVTKGRVKFEDLNWKLSLKEYYDLRDEIEIYPNDKTKNLSQIDNLLKSGKTQKWISIPKIFQLGDEVFETFEIDLKPIIGKEISPKNHLDLHKKYFIIINNAITIPINLKILYKGTNKLYGKRVIQNDGVCFSFFLDKEFFNIVYKITIPIQNDLITDKYQEYLKNQQIAYSTGAKGFNGFASNLLNSLVQNGSGFLLGKKFGALNLTMNAVNIPFKMYKEKQQGKYELQKIIEEPIESNILLDFEIFEKIIPNNSVQFSFTYYKWQDGGVTRDGFVITNENVIINNRKSYFYILVEQPSEQDILKIEQDQLLFGAIQNRFELDCKNPLIFNELTKDHLYWQGMINPHIRVVSQDMLNEINKNLSDGIKILKNKSNVL